MNPIVTIILPIYNTEKMLPICLRSFSDQSFENFEVLMINDGSLDDSEIVCKEFARKDPRFHYYEQENAGKSAAVNYGYSLAKGTYVCIFDSDDYIASNLLETTVKLAEEKQVDIVNFGYYYKKAEKLSKRSTLFPKNQVITRDDFINLLKRDAPMKSNFLWFTWTNLFRKSLLDTHNILHELNLGVSSDSIFNLECYLNAKGIYAIDQPLYYYIYHPQSLSQVRYKPNLISEIRNQFDKKLETLNKYSLKDSDIFADMAKYYVEHSLFLLVANEKNTENGLNSKKLKEFRNMEVYAYCFIHYKGSKYLPLKKKLFIKLFQYRMFKIYDLLHKIFRR